MNEKLSEHKMDLLRSVLQRLPIGRIVELARFDWEFVRERARNVNRLDLTALIDKLRSSGVRPDQACRAIALSNGEFTGDPRAESDLYRAAFLGNYEVYKNSQASDRCPNISLRSSSEEIRRLAAHRLNNFAEVDQIVDVASIPWTSDMKLTILANLLGQPRDIMYRNFISTLMGYLRYPNTTRYKATNPYAFTQGYIIAAMENVSDRFAHQTELENRLFEIIYPITIGYQWTMVMEGYFGAFRNLRDIATTAIGTVWPEFLEKGLKEDYEHFADVAGGITKKSINDDVTVGLVKRARRMLTLENDYPNLFDKLFRSYLLILLGLEVDLNGLDGPDREFLIREMMMVAHPQLTRELVNQVRDRAISHSPVLYDLVNYFHVFSTELPEFGTVNWYKLQVLIASGQAIKIWDTPLFRKLYIER